jgi:hypothetical protein
MNPFLILPDGTVIVVAVVTGEPPWNSIVTISVSLYPDPGLVIITFATCPDSIIAVPCVGNPPQYMLLQPNSHSCQ